MNTNFFNKTLPVTEASLTNEGFFTFQPCQRVNTATTTQTTFIKLGNK